MNKDTRRLKSLFHFKQPKKGDLVLTAQIHRVLKVEETGVWSSDYKVYRKRKVAIVVDVFPECESCKRFFKTRKGKRDIKRHGKRECCHEHVMEIGAGGGQGSVMSVKWVNNL